MNRTPEGKARQAASARPRSNASDDAGGGRRGARAKVTPELLESLERHYGLRLSTEPADLGGSSNLNLHLRDGSRRLVARVYRPSVSPVRLSEIQRARRRLAERGFRCPLPLAASDGNDYIAVGDRLAEVEDYVDHDGHMDTWDRVESGMRVLAQMHEVLEPVSVSVEAYAPRFVNYIAPENVVEATARGTTRIRSWPPTPAEAWLADAADELASTVDRAQQAIDYPSLPRQLVHGDFWDNNVLYRGDNIVLIHDFDHMDERPRIDDAALTLYYMNSERPAGRNVDRRMQLLGRLVVAYDSGLETNLTAAEKAAIPVALARQPLWSVGGWIAELDDDDAARSHAAGLNTAVEFSLEIMRNLPRWQTTFSSGGERRSAFEGQAY